MEDLSGVVLAVQDENWNVVYELAPERKQRGRADRAGPNRVNPPGVAHDRATRRARRRCHLKIARLRYSLGN